MFLLDFNLLKKLIIVSFDVTDENVSSKKNKRHAKLIIVSHALKSL